MNREKKVILVFSLIIIILLIFIVFLVINKNKNLNDISITGAIQKTNSGLLDTKKELTLTLITDKRNKDTSLDSFIANLKNNEPYLKEAEIKELDFSDESVKNFLRKNHINKLPAIIFSTNEIETENTGSSDLKRYLTQLESSEYYLEIGATYNPFSASDRGVSTIEKNILEEIKNDTYFLNDKNKKIIWLEYNDLSCEFCKNFNNSGIIEEVLKNNEDLVAKGFNHFIVNDLGQFEFLECFAEQKGEKELFNFMKNLFSKGIYKLEDLSKESENYSINSDEIQICLLSGKFKQKIEKQMQRAISIFGVNSTPTSIFINSKTGEYKVLAGFDKNLGVKPYLDTIESLK